MTVDHNRMKEYKRILDRYKQEVLNKRERQEKIKQLKKILYPFIAGIIVGIVFCFAL